VGFVVVMHFWLLHMLVLMVLNKPETVTAVPTASFIVLHLISSLLYFSSSFLFSLYLEVFF
jgi:hypothetical protein